MAHGDLDLIVVDLPDPKGRPGPRIRDLTLPRDARMFLVTATQPVAARRAIEHAHRLNPQLDIIARVHHDSLLTALSGLPRTRLVQGDVELAYAMARFMLLASGTSAIETEALIFDARRGEPGTSPTRFVEIPVPRLRDAGGPLPR